jgi:mercuric ion transport protein
MTEQAIQYDQTKSVSERGVAGVGVLASAAALLSAAACCVLPLVLVAFGLGAGGLAWFVPFHLPLTVAAFVLVALGWFLHLRKARVCSADGCEKPAHIGATRLVLLIATTMIGMSALWGFIEQPLMRALGGA